MKIRILDSFKKTLNTPIDSDRSTLSRSLIGRISGGIGFCSIIGIALLMLLVTPVEAADSYGILDAGLIEWGDGYVRAVDGFELIYDGKRIYGDELYLDTRSNFSQLDQVHFTGCFYDKPHYLVGAKQLEMIPQEKMIFRGVDLRWGSLQVPVPFPIVLKYQDGAYQFPDWLPELLYSPEKGLGVRLHAVYAGGSHLEIAGNVDVTSKGGVAGEVKADYRPISELRLHGGMGFNRGWTGVTSLHWRENETGLTGEYLWSKEDTGVRQKISLNYKQPQWQINSWLDQVTGQSWVPTAEWKFQGNTKGVDYSLVNGVTKVTEKESGLSHAKVYISNHLSDEYRLGNIGFGWSFRPTHSWVPTYGVAGQGQTDLWIKTLYQQGWNLKVGYGRTDEWGVTLPEDWVADQTDEYVSTGVSYTRRNELDEGWDFSLSGQYSLEQEQLTAGELELVRALDCYDWKINLDLIDFSTKVGLQLKY